MESFDEHVPETRVHAHDLLHLLELSRNRVHLSVDSAQFEQTSAYASISFLMSRRFLGIERTHLFEALLDEPTMIRIREVLLHERVMAAHAISATDAWSSAMAAFFSACIAPRALTMIFGLLLGLGGGRGALRLGLLLGSEMIVAASWRASISLSWYSASTRSDSDAVPARLLRGLADGRLRFTSMPSNRGHPNFARTIQRMMKATSMGMNSFILGRIASIPLRSECYAGKPVQRPPRTQRRS